MDESEHDSPAENPCGSASTALANLVDPVVVVDEGVITVANEAARDAFDLPPASTAYRLARPSARSGIRSRPSSATSLPGPGAPSRSRTNDSTRESTAASTERR